MIRLVNYTALDESAHERLLAIRNSPDIRRHAHTREPIGWEEHLKWVESLRDNEGRGYYAVMVDGTVVGGVHWSDSEPGKIVWGIFFVPEASAWMIAATAIAFIDTLFERSPRCTLVSSVHAENLGAIRFNRQLGFKKCAETADFWTMELDEAGWRSQKEGKILRTIIQNPANPPVQMEP